MLNNCNHEPTLNYQAILRLKRKSSYKCKKCDAMLSASNWAIVEHLRYAASILGILFCYFIPRFLDSVLGITTVLETIAVSLISIILTYIVLIIITILFMRIYLAYVRAYYKMQSSGYNEQELLGETCQPNMAIGRNQDTEHTKGAQHQDISYRGYE